MEMLWMEMVENLNPKPRVLARSGQLLPTVSLRGQGNTTPRGNHGGTTDHTQGTQGTQQIFSSGSPSVSAQHSSLSK